MRTCWLGCIAAGVGLAVPARAEEPLPSEDRIIQTIQPKRHSRSGRWEVSPHGALVANDPFIWRYVLGAGVAYHPSEVLGVELDADFSPDLGRGDWKPITAQLIDKNNVTPGVSRWMWSTGASLLFSPVHAKAALRGHLIDFELFGRVGAAIVHTEDDPETLGDPDGVFTLRTLSENHPAAVAGGGVRAQLGGSAALRIEGRSVSYTETLEGGSLQKKNYAVLFVGVGFFLP